MSVAGYGPLVRKILKIYLKLHMEKIVYLQDY